MKKYNLPRLNASQGGGILGCGENEGVKTQHGSHQVCVISHQIPPRYSNPSVWTTDTSTRTSTSTFLCGLLCPSLLNTGSLELQDLLKGPILMKTMKCSFQLQNTKCTESVTVYTSFLGSDSEWWTFLVQNLNFTLKIHHLQREFLCSFLSL